MPHPAIRRRLTVIFLFMLCVAVPAVLLYQTGNYCTVKLEASKNITQPIKPDIPEKQTKASNKQKQKCQNLKYIRDNPVACATLITHLVGTDDAPIPHQNSEKKPEDRWSGFICEAKVTDFALALFTFWLVISTFLLWDGSEKTAERGQRAYILIHRITVKNVEVGKIPQFKITVKNFGQTPAKNMTYWASPGFDTFPPTLNAPPGRPREDQRFKSPLGPGAEVNIRPSFAEVLNTATLATIKANTHAFYVIGEIFYEDAFGIERTTKFKFFANGNTGINAMSTCEDGNDYT